MLRAPSVRGRARGHGLAPVSPRAGKSGLRDDRCLAAGSALAAMGRPAVGSAWLAVGAGLPAKQQLLSRCAACMVALCLMLSAPAFAVVLPPSVQAQHPELDQVGGGEMRWLGFKLYDAALWASARGEAAVGGAHVLSIRYARAIGSERLVAVSLDEMRRLGFTDEEQLARWGEALAAVLPSVAAGDTLAALHRPGEGALFWHQDRPSGEIRDPELARAFFAIWLDPRTREPQLRAQLLGLAEGGR
ncbi:MAG: hypothetical protein PWP40_1940 [Rhodocyclaceae bacterium]|nr:hypothetical protein [Rhodocyclaceae bacterium]